MTINNINPNLSTDKLVSEILDQIRKKLLDLTGRNSLLNYKFPKKSIRIINKEVANIYLTLVEKDKPMYFIPLPEEKEIIDSEEQKAKATQLTLLNRENKDTEYHGQSPDFEENNSIYEINGEQLQTGYKLEKLESILRKMSSDSRLALEETGMNLLYLAIGFLSWTDRNTENDSNEDFFKAPLLLIPVKIEKDILYKDSQYYSYKISYQGDDLEYNICLAEKLKQDFDIVLPGLDSVISDDNGNDDIVSDFSPDKYFELVQKVIGKKNKWEVNKEVVLGFFQFSKLRMYKDLNWQENRSLLGNEIIEDLLLGKQTESPVSSSFDDYPIDKDKKASSIIPVLDADSSQHSFLVNALEGENLVCQGPPGTGKSQTITNLIAAALGEGKTVLFMSEKHAALDVVRRKLEKVNLDDFCLELHSNKANKKLLYNELKKRLDRKFTYPDEIVSKTNKLEGIKRDLYRYIESLNENIDIIQESVYEVFGKVSKYHQMLSKTVRLQELKPLENIDRDGIKTRINILDSLKRSVAQTGHLYKGTWKGFIPKKYAIGDDDFIKDILLNIIKYIGDTEKVMIQFENISGLKLNHSIGFINSVTTIDTKILKSVPCDVVNGIITSMNPKCHEEIEQFIGLLNSYNDSNQKSTIALKNTENINTQKAHDLLSKLTNVVNTFGEIATSKNLEFVKNMADKLMTIAKSINEDMQKYKIISIDKSKSFKELEKIIKIIHHLKTCPAEIKRVSYDRCLEEQALDIFNETRMRGKDLKEIRTALEKSYYINDIPYALSTSSDMNLKQISITLRKRAKNSFKLFYSDYRKAKDLCKGFLKNTKNFLKKDFFCQLGELEEYLNNSKSFQNNLKAQTYFAELFNGEETDWAKVEAVIIWYRKLVELCGSKKEAMLYDKNRVNIDTLPETDTFVKQLEAFSSTYEEFLNCSSGLKYSINNPNLNDINFEEIPCLLKNISEEIGQALEDIGSYLYPDHSFLSARESCKYLIQSHKLQEKIETYEEVKNILGEDFNGVSTDQVTILNTLSWLEDMKKSCLPIEIKGYLKSSLLHEKVAEVLVFIQELIESENDLNSTLSELYQYGEINSKDFYGCSTEELDLNGMNNKFRLCIEQIDLLQPWSSYIKLRDDAVKLGLECIIEKAESGEIEFEEIDSHFNYVLYKTFATKIVNNNQTLMHFTGNEYEVLRNEFVEADKEIMELQQQKTAYMIEELHVRPDGIKKGRVSQWTEMGLINNEVLKKTRHIPIRKLVERAGNALLALKPCFMMSPLSVAQYIKPGTLTFDLIIIDEASQLKSEDSLGALARGKQIVVVGDSKQLPPSSYFEHIGEDNIPDDVDPLSGTESILDVCSRTYNSRMLKWHYRSQHQSLIAFSNNRYYDNRLIVCPSPYDDNAYYGIRYTYVKGATFQSGDGGGRNVMEAEAVAEAIIKHAKEHPKLTLGVGTMNIHQKYEIEERLERATKADPVAREAVEKLNQLSDPLFIKNIETIQGDERDVIFISTTYGPDSETKKVFKRFGPINSKGGERRLNVLFTRAKVRMEIFTSMLSTDISLDHNSSQGARDLKDFLKYVETGSLPENGRLTGKEPDSDFEISVANEIKKLGYTISYQVGVSGFFIDIGVHNPKDNKTFMLGIECDGKTYHSSTSARDRDRIREEILRDRGWNIYRIWSTDWFKNRVNTIAKLKNVLQKFSDGQKIDSGNISNISNQSKIENAIHNEVSAEAVRENKINSTKTPEANNPSSSNRLEKESYNPNKENNRLQHALDWCGQNRTKNNLLVNMRGAVSYCKKDLSIK